MSIYIWNERERPEEKSFGRFFFMLSFRVRIRLTDSSSLASVISPFSMAFSISWITAFRSARASALFYRVQGIRTTSLGSESYLRKSGIILKVLLCAHVFYFA